MQLLLMKDRTEIHTKICMWSSDIDRMFEVNKLLVRYQQNVTNEELAVLINTFLMHSAIEIIFFQVYIVTVQYWQLYEISN